MKRKIRVIIQDITNHKNKLNSTLPIPELYRDYEVDDEMLEPEFNLSDMIETLLKTEYARSNKDN